MKSNEGRVFTLLCRVASIGLGLVFLFAAFSKIGDLKEFQRAADGLVFLPQWIRGLTILFLPGIELAVGLCLLSGKAIREAGFIGAGLLLIFLALSVHSSFVGSTAVGCHCFKIPTPAWLNLSGWQVVVRNLVFLILFIMVFAGAKPPCAGKSSGVSNPEL